MKYNSSKALEKNYVGLNGRFVFEDALDFYEGNFEIKNDVINAEGLLTLENGTRYDGSW